MPLFPLLRQWLTGHNANDEGDASDPGWTRPDDWLARTATVTAAVTGVVMGATTDMDRPRPDRRPAGA
jgi:hypothetical protein